MKDIITITLVSFAVASIVCVPMVILTWPNFLLIGYVIMLFLSIVLGPVIFYSYMQRSRLLDMEKHFPSFLRDLAESKRAGLNLPSAVINSSHIDYGPLSNEIKTMSNQLSWDVPLPKVLKMFQDRIQKSTYLNRAMAIVMESYYGGGDIAATMDAIANSIGQLKEVENERESVLREQVIIIYAIHFIFVGIIISMFKIMIPILGVQGGAGVSIFQTTGAPPNTDYFKGLFFLTLVIQSSCNGFVAGQSKEGSLVAGFKHTLIMLTVAIVGYTTFILPKSISLIMNLNDNEAFAGAEFRISGTLSEENEAVKAASIIVSVGSNEKVTSTNENGAYDVRISAPLTPGIYKISVTAIFKNNEKTIYKEVLVKGE